MPPGCLVLDPAGRRLDVIFIFDNRRIGVPPHHPRVVHKVGPVQSDFLSIFGFDCGDFRLSREVELGGVLFHI